MQKYTHNHFKVTESVIYTFGFLAFVV